MLQALIWHESYSVGHDGLDDEHCAILKIVNSIIAADIAAPNEVQGLFNELSVTSEKHFQHESSVLRRIILLAPTASHRPIYLKVMSENVITEHIVDHSRAYEEMISIIKGQDRARQAEQLKKWFIDHAVRYDAHLKAIFQAIRDERPELLSQIL